MNDTTNLSITDKIRAIYLNSKSYFLKHVKQVQIEHVNLTNPLVGCTNGMLTKDNTANGLGYAE
jgi:hypothetical protein